MFVAFFAGKGRSISPLHTRVEQESCGLAIANGRVNAVVMDDLSSPLGEPMHQHTYVVQHHLNCGIGYSAR